MQAAGTLKGADLARLVVLGAIWGASFLFVRVCAPVLGPVLTADLRMLIGGLALLAWFRAIAYDIEWRRWWKAYAIAGILTSAAPFRLYSYAALSLTAGQMSVINATSPMWGALLAALLVGERLAGRRVLGLLLGVAGVVLIARPNALGGPALLPVAASLAAAFCYGAAAAYLRRWASDAPARGMSVGTQLISGLMVLPLVAVAPPAHGAAPLVWASLAGLGVVCSGIAYILYFRLIADVGPTSALTVTYLTPLFGIFWGALFLGEPLTAAMLGGAALVILGTLYVLRS